MKKKVLMLIIMVLLTIPFMNVEAATKVNMYIFYGDGCSYCHNLLNFMSRLENDPEYNYMFKVNKYEIWSSSENRGIMNKIAAGFDDDVSGVPYYVIGDKSYSGFGEATSGPEIKAQIKRCYENNVEDYAVKYMREKTPTTTKRYTSQTTTSTTKITTTTTIKPTSHVTTTFNELTTTNKTEEITTTKKVETSAELPKDKNGNLPKDVINKFIELLNKKDEKALDYLSTEALKNFSDEEIKDMLINETSITVRFNEDYLTYENEYLDDEFITQRTYVFTARFEGKMSGFEIDNDSSEVGKIHVILEDGEYKIDNLDYEIKLGIGDMFNAFGIFGKLLSEELGVEGVLFVLLLIAILFLSFLPYIIGIVIIVAIIRAVTKGARARKDAIEQGVIPPNNNGQGY